MANLPPVSTTLAKLATNFAIAVPDTGGKFASSVVDTAAGVIDTNGNLPPVVHLNLLTANFCKKLEMV